jgi:alkanesulfonate monooxygenase SsuD/methylene tetrahydromethanopterin reductase-like flavin-dependent oxidoreductase (luciferase family)
LERIVHADEMGLDSFAIGEHHRRDFFFRFGEYHSRGGGDVPNTWWRRYGFDAADPVRVFQNFATLDLVSNDAGVAGRGSFTEAYPLFGLRLNDYDRLF